MSIFLFICCLTVDWTTYYSTYKTLFFILTMFKCQECHKSFDNGGDYQNHTISCGSNRCQSCNKNFLWPDALTNHKCSKMLCSKCKIDSAGDLLNHICLDRPSNGIGSGLKNGSDNELFHCRICNISISTRNKNAHKKSLFHKQRTIIPTYTDKSIDIVTIESTFKMRVATYRVYNRAGTFTSINNFMTSVKDRVIQLIQDKIHELSAIKINFELFAQYILQKSSTDLEIVGDIKSFNTRFDVINKFSNISEIYDRYSSKIEAKSQEFQERDSGWTLTKLLFLEININQYNPIK